MEMVEALLTPLFPGAENQIAIAGRSKLRSGFIELCPDLIAIRDLPVEGEELPAMPLVQPTGDVWSRIFVGNQVHESRVRDDPPLAATPVALDARHLLDQRHGLGAFDRIPQGNDTRQTSHWCMSSSATGQLPVSSSRCRAIGRARPGKDSSRCGVSKQWSRHRQGAVPVQRFLPETLGTPLPLSPAAPCRGKARARLRLSSAPWPGACQGGKPAHPAPPTTCAQLNPAQALPSKWEGGSTPRSVRMVGARSTICPCSSCPFAGMPGPRARTKAFGRWLPV